MAAYMTAKEIAEELNITPERARGLIMARMPHIRVGRNEFRVKRTDFEAYLRKITVQPIYKH